MSYADLPALELTIVSYVEPGSSTPLDVRAAERLAEQFGAAPPWAVVLGSGLGELLSRLDDARRTTHAALGLPVPAVAGHQGIFALGRLQGAPVLLVSGRVHLYEGYPPADVVAGVRALARWGIEKLVLTNAAGSCRPDWAPGTLVRMTDHIDLTNGNPLVGRNRDDLGPRFPDLSRAYDPELGAQADVLAEQLGVSLERGVYAAMRGPSYETAAEVRMLGRIGADVVGMSTVPEVIAAVHAGLRVLAFSVVSNYGTGLGKAPTNHAAVTRIVSQAAAPLAELVARLVAA